jgi:hypothetical protein
MNFSINKAHFKMRKDKDLDSFFKKSNENLLFILPIIFGLILSPTIIVGSILSQTVFLIIANALLSIGFIIEFCGRIYRNEVSFTEFMLSLIVMTGLFLVAFYFLPGIPGFGVIGALCFINLLATSINSFFLIRNLIIPPVLELIKYFVLKVFGYEMKARIYNADRITEKEHRGVTNRLFTTFYKQESSASEVDISVDFEEKIKPFNNTIEMLEHYVNKYQKPVLGYLNRYIEIQRLQSAATRLAEEGHTDAAFGFIKMKLPFKKQKMSELTRAKEKLQTEAQSLGNNLHTFFSPPLGMTIGNSPENIQQGIKLLEAEILRQSEKIAKLEACLPEPQKHGFLILHK